MTNTIRAAIVVAAVLLASACGGDSGPSTPTSPPPIPSAQTCDSLGGAASTPGVAILNGSSCSPDRSSVVLLNMRTSDGTGLGACTGTLITRRAILTAAHCLDGGVGIVRVWLGSGEQIDAESFVFYPGFVFNNPSFFDVGVVMMADELPRAPIPVLTSRDAQVGEAAIIAGWGRDQNLETATLRAGSTTISVVGASLLQTRYAPPSSSVCLGDSGGPILLQEGGVWSIAGITSATTANICQTGDNIYQAVRHASVRDFILQHVPDAVQR